MEPRNCTVQHCLFQRSIRIKHDVKQGMSCILARHTSGEIEFFIINITITKITANYNNNNNNNNNNRSLMH